MWSSVLASRGSASAGPGGFYHSADRVVAILGRFSAPVYPGEILRTEIWNEPQGVAFRVWAAERKVMVINNGRVGLRG